MKLITLGHLDLRDDANQSITAVLNQSRRFALLVFLSIEGRKGHVRRDHIVGMFWPDSSDKVARKTLSQSLWFLRRSLGADAILSQGDGLRLNPDRVSCDASDLLDLAEAGDDEGLEAFSSPHFLAGVFDSGSAAFEHWVDRQRRNIVELWSESAWRRAERMAAQGHIVGAAAVARLAAETAPADEGVLRRLMEFLVRIGDSAGASHAYECFKREHGDEDGIPVSHATVAFVKSLRVSESVDSDTDTLPPAGRRDLTPVRAAEVVVSNPEVEPLESESAGGLGPTSEPSARRRRGAVLITAIALVLGAAMISLHASWPSEASDSLPITLLLEDPTVHSWLSQEEARFAQQLDGALKVRLGELRPHMEVVSVHEPAYHASGARTYRLRALPVISGAEAAVTVVIMDAGNGSIVRSRHIQLPPGTGGHQAASQVAVYARRAIGDDIDFRREVDTSDWLKGLGPLARAAVNPGAYADSIARFGNTAHVVAELKKVDAVLQYIADDSPDPTLVHLARAKNARTRASAVIMTTADVDQGWPALWESIKHAENVLSTATDPSTEAEALQLIAGAYMFRRGSPSIDLPTQMQVRQYAEKAVFDAIETGAAGAATWTHLSLMHSWNGDFEEAHFAAGQAIRSDPFLKSGLSVRLTLFTTSLELRRTEEAHRWCSEVVMLDRMSGQYCRLQLIADRHTVTSSDLDTARAIIKEIDTSTPLISRLWLESLLAVITAKHGLYEEARQYTAVLAGASQQHPGLMLAEARIWLHLGDEHRAWMLASEYIAEAPFDRREILHSRPWKELAERIGVR